MISRLRFELKKPILCNTLEEWGQFWEQYTNFYWTKESVTRFARNSRSKNSSNSYNRE